MTVQPLLYNREAAQWPMPAEAPVMSTTCSVGIPRLPFSDVRWPSVRLTLLRAMERKIDLTIFDGYGSVKPGEFAQPVGDIDHRLAGGGDQYILEQSRCHVLVQSRRGLIKNEDRRIGQKYSSQSNPLPLATSKPLLHHCTPCS